MTSIEQGFRPQDAAASWALTMMRPLIHPRRRALFEGHMAEAFDTAPVFCQTYVAGVLTCIVATLPNNDPWRHISARAGDLVAGQQPPPSDGVIRDDKARRFGTWRDATDVIIPVFAEPESDPSLAELVVPLSPEGGLLMAAAGRGDWRATRDMMAALSAQLGAGIDDFGRSHIGSLGAMSRDVAREAIAWSLHRRLSYGGDVYSEEILLRWTVLATRVALTEGQAKDPEFAAAHRRAAELTDEEVRTTIERWRIPDAARDGIGDVVGEDADLAAWVENPI